MALTVLQNYVKFNSISKVYSQEYVLKIAFDQHVTQFIVDFIVDEFCFLPVNVVNDYVLLFPNNDLKKGGICFLH